MDLDIWDCLGRIKLIAKFRMTDLDICSHSRDRGGNPVLRLNKYGNAVHMHCILVYGILEMWLLKQLMAQKKWPLTQFCIYYLVQGQMDSAKFKDSKAFHINR